MDVSVIICTRNRAPSLQRCLQSIARMAVPEGLRWELVIVDNGSSDATQAVVASFAGVLPIVPALEPRAGMSRARNCGVQAASGTYFVWTDDDVVVDPQWLTSYADAFRHWPEAALFGGKIIPVLDEPSPAWFKAARDEFALLLAHRDFGDAPRPMNYAEGIIPFGANFAIRAADQRAFPYDPQLGASPGLNRIAEETEVIRAILASGRTGYWIGGSKVEHCIPLHRQTIAYVKIYYGTQGETAASLTGPTGEVLLFGVPRWLWRRVGALYFGYCLQRFTAAPQHWCRTLKNYAYYRGVLAFHIAVARH